MLVTLLERPVTPEDWNRWGFHHVDSHQRIIEAIVSKAGPTLTLYQIYPVPPDDFQGWLARHSQMHIEMDSILGVQSEDLESVDPRNETQFQSWIASHWLEHQTAEERLGI